jgi:hypothetical protein
MGDELLEEGCFSRSIAAHDARAPLLAFQAFQENVPIHARREPELDFLNLRAGEWILVGEHPRSLCRIANLHSYFFPSY